MQPCKGGLRNQSLQTKSSPLGVCRVNGLFMQLYDQR